MARIVIIDDDLAMDILVENLHYRGHEVYRIATVKNALDDIVNVCKSDLVILDIIMSWPKDIERGDLPSDRSAGMEIYREIRKKNQNLPIIVYTASQDASIINAIEDDSFSSYLSKWESVTMCDLITLIYHKLGIEYDRLKSQVFIVHGHSEKDKLALKNYLQNTLKLPEPIILHERPNLGRTIIEKFEDFAAISSIVFVLLTPDDIVVNGDETNDIKWRARQNVIFEMGYFLGTLGRKSGRVILLYYPPLELPSDISGIIYIDISQGIDSAGEKIRQEVENVRS